MKRSIVCVLLAGCGGPATLTVTAPSGTAELVPGGTLAISWTSTGGGHLAIDAIPLQMSSGPRIFDQDVPDGAGTLPWAGVDVGATPLPPGVYAFAFTFDGAAVDSNAGAMVDGIVFTDPAAGTTVPASGAYDIKVTTVSQRPLDLTFTLGTLVFATKSIGGEFVPFGRTIHFDGTDVNAQPVPAGSYVVGVTAQDPSGPLTYAVTGGTLAWTP